MIVNVLAAVNIDAITMSFLSSNLSMLYQREKERIEAISISNILPIR